MARFLKSRLKARGASPGELIFLGKQKMEEVKIRLIQYNTTDFKETSFENLDEALLSIKNDYINWLNIDGIHNIEIIKKTGVHFNLSSISLENILNTGQRAKFIEDNNAITLITKAINLNKEAMAISVEQISFFVLQNVVISFQERIGDHFEPVRTRIRNNIGRIRKSSADYLSFTLIDALVDNYLINLEQIGERIESLEHKTENPTKELSRELFQLKTEVAYFRKSIRPMKEMLTRVLNSNSDFFNDKNEIYYQELFDLIEQANEASDNYLTMTNDLINLYNTNLSHKENQVMKVLTIFASIFIPLTFIAGIYGTNFEYLPELKYKFAYFIMWGVMIIVAMGMLVYFKKQKWF
jgi:magnesium transporter